MRLSVRHDGRSMLVLADFDYLKLRARRVPTEDNKRFWVSSSLMRNVADFPAPIPQNVLYRTVAARQSPHYWWQIGAGISKFRLFRLPDLPIRRQK
jgi:hypothetical protein